MIKLKKKPVELLETERKIRDNVRKICEDFGHNYWKEHDSAGEYPSGFVDILADHGWLGIHIPDEYGGVGMSTEGSW